MPPRATAVSEQVDVSVEFLLSGIAALLILVYLVYAVLRPERF